MTESRQPRKMRARHLIGTLDNLRKASAALAEARDWAFDLDYFPERLDVAKAKDQVEQAIAGVSRVLTREFPDE
jgi:hypothetical protein